MAIFIQLSNMPTLLLVFKISDFFIVSAKSSRAALKSSSETGVGT